MPVTVLLRIYNKATVNNVNDILEYTKTYPDCDSWDLGPALPPNSPHFLLKNSTNGKVVAEYGHNEVIGIWVS